MGFRYAVIGSGRQGTSAAYDISMGRPALLLWSARPVGTRLLWQALWRASKRQQEEFRLNWLYLRPYAKTRARMVK